MLSLFAAPHSHAPRRMPQIMRQVMFAMLPGITGLVIAFGPGILLNLLLSVVTALLTEAGILRLRQRPVIKTLNDGSAMVTAMLLAVALPAIAPWWIAVLGTFFAVAVTKQLFGGLGQNPFNPAMAAYAFLLISFPLEMSLWPQPFDWHMASLPWHETADAMTGATPLDAFRHKGMLTAEEFWQQPQLLSPDMVSAWAWVALGWALGGAWLLWQRVIHWQAPVGMLSALSLLAAFFYGVDPSHYASPWFHWISGAAILSAFFIVTDPVSGATSRLGQLFFGLGVGVLVYVIRTWGNYPDAVAFAVLLMNFAAPTIDYYTRPRVHGHRKAQRGLKQKDSMP